MYFFGALALILLAAMAYVRFTPIAAHHATPRPPARGPGDYALDGGHYVVRALDCFDRDALNGAIAKTPRLTSLGDGVYLTRSRFWAFPDVTEIWEADGTLHIFSHLVYGRRDFGANRTRIEGWLSAAAS